nr:MAG TPA: resuscitation-promoting factor [Caudoviricetes sp.]
MRKLTKTTVQVAAVVALTAGLVAMATPSNNSKIKYDSQQSASNAAGSSKTHKMDKISSERERLAKEAKRNVDDKKKQEAEAKAKAEAEAKKQLTWQDNPQKCDESKQWIAADAPFNCIDKPQAQAPAKPSQPAATPAPQRQAVAAAPAGCQAISSILLANGISAGDLPYALNIAQKESGCNPNAVNPNGGACAYFQELPCGKWGGTGNIAGHIRGADAYAKNRYGGWAQAWASWQAKHWW